MPGKISLPAYSTLTKFKTPELSSGEAPPIIAVVDPSTTLSQAAVPLTSLLHLLIGALPKITIPPQRPLALSGLVKDPSIAEAAVNLIGLDLVPLATIFEPL